MAVETERFGEDYFERAPLRHSNVLTQSAYRNLVLSWLAGSEPRLLKGAGRRALEIGCGYGYAAELFADLGYDTVGTDLSPYAVERARAVSRVGLRFECWDATTDWAHEAAFDLIAAFEVVEHLADPRSAIQRWSEMLAPKGALVLTTPNRWGAASRHWRDPTHVSILTSRAWRRVVCNAATWSRVRVSTAQFIPFVWRHDGIMRFVPLPLIGANLRILAVRD